MIGECMQSTNNATTTSSSYFSQVCQLPSKLVHAVANYMFPTKPIPEAYNGAVSGKIIPKIRIIYVNGILNTPLDCITSTQKISDVFNQSKVYFTHVTSQGGVRDTCAVLSSLARKIEYKSAAQQVLIDNIRKRLADLDCEDEELQTREVSEEKSEGVLQVDDSGAIECGKRVIVITHSAGGLLLEQVSKHLSEKERECLYVYTLGSAVLLSKNIFKKAENHICHSDSIPSICDKISRRNREKDVHSNYFKWPHKIGSIESHYFLGSPYQSMLALIKESVLPSEKEEVYIS